MRAAAIRAILAATVLVLVTWLPSSALAADPAVPFRSMGLLMAVREAIGKPTGVLRQSDLLGLETLNASEREIAHLRGLEYCVNLTSLALFDNEIEDITPIAGLTKLTLLGLSGNRIAGISALSGLTGLTSLYLDNNQVADISPLSGLTKLERIHLDDNQITDISALEGLTRLKELHLNDNQITDISPLVRNSGLGMNDEVQVESNPLSQRSLYRHLATLELRRVEMTPSAPEGSTPAPATSTPAPAPAATSSATIQSRSATAVSFPDANLAAVIRDAISKPTGGILVSDLLGLTSLTADGRGISDLSGLEHCINLNQLSLWSNQIDDISPLAGLTNLTRLILGRNQITNISALAELTSLTVLDLDSNQVVDLSALAALQSLEDLVLSANQVGVISPLAGLTGLWYLRLDNNQVVDISAIAGLPNLVLLDLSGNQIADAAPLVQNSGIGAGDTIHLVGNPLNDDSMASQLPELRERQVDILWDAPAPTKVAAAPTGSPQTAVSPAASLEKNPMTTTSPVQPASRGTVPPAVWIGAGTAALAILAFIGYKRRTSPVRRSASETAQPNPTQEVGEERAPVVSHAIHVVQITSECPAKGLPREESEVETEEPSLVTAGAIVEQDLDIGLAGAETLFVGQWSDLIVEVTNSGGNSAGRVVVGVEGPVECRRKRFAVLSSGGSKTIIVPVLPTAAGQSVELVLRVSYRDPENLKRQSSHRVLVPIRGRRAPGSSETL